MDTTRILKELWFTFDHSQGRGGQNVNKVATRATLFFAVAESDGLTDGEKAVVSEKLKNRIFDGVLKVTRSNQRSASANKEKATEDFLEMVDVALFPDKIRIKVERPERDALGRLHNKSRRAGIKKSRKKFKIRR